MYETIDHGNGIFSIEEDFVRAFLFAGSERALLVDSCSGSSDITEAVKGITDKPVTLINTHADDDHTGGNAAYKKTLMHPADFAWYCEETPALAEEAPPVAVWEGNILDIGGRAFEIIHIPGHTPGSIALYDKESRLLVAGDSVSLTPVFIFPPVRSIRAYASSMEKLLKYADGIDRVYASHGPMELGAGQIEKQLAAARKLIAGELSGEEPPFELPALMYAYEGAAFFY